MRFPSTLYRLLIFGAFLATPTLSSAQTPAAGGSAIGDIFYALAGTFSFIWITVGALVIFISGFTLMISEQEGAIDKAKKSIVAVLIGGIIIEIIISIGSGNIISYLYRGVAGTNIDFTSGLNPGQFSIESEGVAGWLTAIAATLGLTMIIIAAVRAAGSLGGDEAAYTNVRLSLLHVIVGLIIIGGALAFKTAFFTAHEPSALILLVTGKIEIVLSFILLIAVAILVYAGFRMVASFGREEDYSSAKSLAIRVLVGILVILLSFSAVFIVAHIFS